MTWKALTTHVSWLVFTDERVYKGKRPVRLDFLDLSSLSARRRACRRELELNRRLAPDVYQGLGRIRGPQGEEEPMVVMSRLPDDRRLTRLVQTGDPCLPAVLEDLAAVLNVFHQHAARGPSIDRDCRWPAVLRLWEESLTTLGRFPAAAEPGLVAGLGDLARCYLRGRRRLLDARIATGHALDGHGDLLADDIFCLADGPRILDCLEFDDRLRHVDRLADIASLAMDLERLGGEEIASHLLTAYAAGARAWPDSLAHHWMAYRAVVRAKVAAIRHAESALDEDLDEAHRLLGLAHGHLLRGEVRLVLVGGLPGSGKSTLASALAQSNGWALLRSDVIRKEGGATPSYDRVARAAVYREMLARSEELLSQGVSVVMDATWSRPTMRERAGRVAARTSARVIELECAAPGMVRSSRIAHRRRSGVDPSDATTDVSERLEREYAPWPTAVGVDTSSGIPEAVGAAVRAVGPG